MSTEVSLFKGGVPAFLQGAVDVVTDSLAGNFNGGNRRISIKGGVFREYINGKEYRVSEDRSMNVIIINAAPSVSRTYYSGSYVEGETVSPVCWSADSQRPDAKAKNPQATTCISCPQNIKGSGQGESRACRYQQRLAVVLDGELDKGEVYQLVLPSTSIFGDGEKGKLPLQAYARFLKSQGVPITGVVTEMRFDIDSPTPKLVFKPLRGVTEEEYAAVTQLAKSKEAVNAITMTVAQTDGVKDSSEGFETAKPKAVAAPKKSAPEVAPEDIEEPKVATPKKASPVGNDPKLEELVGTWDD